MQRAAFASAVRRSVIGIDECLAKAHGMSEQWRSNAMASIRVIYNEVVGKHESPIQQIFLQAITDDPDNSTLSPRCR